MKYFLTLLVLLWATAVQAITYWASPTGDGATCGTTATSDPGSGYTTFAKGISCLSAGDILTLKSGTYATTFNTAVTALASGSGVNARTEIRSQTIGGAIFRPASGNEVFNIVATGASSGLQYLQFTGFVIDATNTTFGIVVGSGTNYVRFTDVEVKNAGGPNRAAGTGVSIQHNTSNTEWIRGSSHDNGLVKFVPPDASYGFYTEGDSITIDGAKIYNNGGYGIHGYTGFADPHNNHIYRNNEVYNNCGTIQQNGCGGIAAGVGSNHKVYNNLVYNNSQRGIGNSTTGGTVFNNTVVGNGHWGITYDGQYAVSIQNNIIRGNSLGDFYDDDSGAAQITFGANLCSSPGTGCAGTDDPKFVDQANNNFQLLIGSAAIDTGLNLGPTYRIDYAGINRDTQGGSGWDIGAYERQVTTPPVAGNELVLALAFDEGKGTTTVDSSGKNHTVTLNNVTWDTGVYGASLRFNGANSSVIVANSANFNLSNMTLEAWVSPIDLVSPDNFVSVIYKGIFNQPGWGLYAKSDTYICTNLTAMGYFANTINNFACNNAQIFTGGTAWTHIAYTFDGTNSRFYHNGALVATQAASESMINNNGDLQIGASVYDEWFNGWIDEVRVYNYARSPTEIVTDYNTPILQQAPGAAMNVKVSAATEIKIAPTITMKYGQ